jgi:hypothetical protein
MTQKIRVIAIWVIPLLAGLILFLLHTDVWICAGSILAYLLYGWLASDAGDFAGFKSGYQCGLEEGWHSASQKWSNIIKPLIGDVQEFKDVYNKIAEQVEEDQIEDTKEE